MKTKILSLIILAVIQAGCTTYKDVSTKGEFSSYVGSNIKTSQDLYLYKDNDDPVLAPYFLTKWQFIGIPYYVHIAKVQAGTPLNISRIIRERSGNGNTYYVYLGTIIINNTSYVFESYAKVCSPYYGTETYQYFTIVPE